MLTEEQKLIVESNENVRVNAFAGTGKTSSAINYIKDKNRFSDKVLYMAYNKVAADEFKTKAKKNNLNCDVMTSHSLAYRKLAMRGVKLNLNGFFTFNMFKERYQTLFSIYNNDCWRFYKKISILIEDWSYSDSTLCEMQESEVLNQVEVDLCNLIFKDMKNGDIPITHDFYLKGYSELNEQLDYEYIIVDESQDQNFPLLNIVTTQENTIKLFIGDSNQSIYAFRKSLNTLESPLISDYSLLYLTQSFRFPQRIADLANEVLEWKATYTDYVHVPIIGLQEPIEIPGRAVITRTNFELLRQAYFGVQQELSLYIEGDLPLDNFHEMIKSFNEIRCGRSPQLVYLKKFISLQEAENAFGAADDYEKLNMIRIVKAFGEESLNIVPRIKENLVKKPQADVILTNTHKAKGLEYGHITLTDDFIDYRDLTNELKPYERDMVEELNLLYVAITRTGNGLILPVNGNYNRFKSKNLI